MPEKKPPQKPTNLRPYECDLIIDGQHFAKLEISPYYEKHNKEYLEKLERKGIKLSERELAEKLITDDLIRVMIKQLEKEKEIIQEGRYYHWTYYSFRVYHGIKAYRLVWCVADDEPHILGMMNCYRQEKFDKNYL